MAQIPTRINSLSEVTPAWMQAVLMTSGIEAGVKSVSCKAIGDGKISQTGRVHIEYDSPTVEAPRSLVCKLHSPDLAAHQFAIGTGLYRGETNAYKVLREKSACNAPRAYWVAGDIDWINLVLEDLSASTEPGNQIKGCKADDAQAMVIELARLHSAFFPLNADDAPEWLTRLDTAGRAWSAMIVQGAATLKVLLAETLSAEHRAVLEGVPEAVQRFYAYPFRHLTFSHGETRVDNVLFDRLETTPRAIIIDWQNVGLRSPMFDVAYFLSGSVEVEARRAIEEGLLHDYVRQFSIAGRGYTGADARKDYRLNLVSGLFQTAAGAAFLCSDPTAGVAEPVRHFLSTLATRNLHAVADWDSLRALRDA